MEVPLFLTPTTKVWQMIFLPIWTGDCLELSLLLKVLHRLGSSYINISFVRTRPLPSNGCIIIQRSLFCYSSPAYLLYSLSHPPPTRPLTISFPYHPPPCYSETGKPVDTLNTLRTGLLNCLNARSRGLTFRHRASCI